MIGNNEYLNKYSTYQQGTRKIGFYCYCCIIMHFRIMLQRISYICSKMLSSLRDVILKLAKTTSPQKLFPTYCITLYVNKKYFKISPGGDNFGWPGLHWGTMSYWTNLCKFIFSSGSEAFNVPSVQFIHFSLVQSLRVNKLIKLIMLKLIKGSHNFSIFFIAVLFRRGGG